MSDTDLHATVQIVSVKFLQVLTQPNSEATTSEAFQINFESICFNISDFFII